MRRLHALEAVGALLVVGWAVAWTYGMLHRYFDYDELEHVYAAWRIRGGARPFYDFFEVHPPFLWYLLASALSALDRISFPLFPLRFATAAGHLGLLFALGGNLSLSFARLPRPAQLRWSVFALVVLIFAGDLSVIWYLIDFRLDAWPNALMLLAVLRYRRRVDGPLRGAFLLAFVSCLTLLCAPKLAAFFALFALFSLADDDQRLRRALGLAAGTLAALLLGLLGLRLAGISPLLVYRLSVSYHAILATQGGFGHGLARALVGQPHLVAVVTAGLAGWLLVADGRLRGFSFELAVLAFLILQAAFVSFGYPQYYAPWFLLGMIFVPYLELGLRRVPVAHRLVLAGGLLVAGANVARDLRTFTAVDQTAPVVAFNAWAHARVPGEATVAGDLMHMPIYRLSPFYHLAETKLPSGQTTDAAVAQLGISWISERMTPAAYDRELEAGRPALIVQSRLLPRPVNEAVERYRARHRAEYRSVDSPAGTVDLRL